MNPFKKHGCHPGIECKPTRASGLCTLCNGRATSHRCGGTNRKRKILDAYTRWGKSQTCGLAACLPSPQRVVVALAVDAAVAVEVVEHELVLAQWLL